MADNGIIIIQNHNHILLYSLDMYYMMHKFNGTGKGKKQADQPFDMLLIIVEKLFCQQNLGYTKIS